MSSRVRTYVFNEADLAALLSEAVRARGLGELVGLTFTSNGDPGATTAWRLTATADIAGPGPAPEPPRLPTGPVRSIPDFDLVDAVTLLPLEAND